MSAILMVLGYVHTVDFSCGWGTYLRQASMQILAAALDTDWPHSMGKPRRIGDMPLKFVFDTVDEKNSASEKSVLRRLQSGFLLYRMRSIYGFCMNFHSVNKPLVSALWVRVMVKHWAHPTFVSTCLDVIL